MVVQWEDNFYQGNRGHTYLGNPDDRAQIYPDYVRVCNSFNVKCERVMYKKDLRAAIQRMLDAKEAVRARRHHALHRTRAAVHPGKPHRGGHDLETVGQASTLRSSLLGPSSAVAMLRRVERTGRACPYFYGKPPIRGRRVQVPRGSRSK